MSGVIWSITPMRLIRGEPAIRVSLFIKKGERKMKTLIIILVLMVSSVAYPNEVCYQGDLDPAVFMEWQKTDYKPCMGGGIPHIHFIAHNPDKEHPVQAVEGVIIIRVVGEKKMVFLTSYLYTIDGVEYIYRFSPSEECYVLDNGSGV